MEELQLINDVFRARLTEADLDRQVAETLDWESMVILELMAEAQERFHVLLPISEVVQVRTVGDLTRLIRRRRLPG